MNELLKKMSSEEGGKYFGLCYSFGDAAYEHNDKDRYATCFANMMVFIDEMNKKYA